MDKHLCILIKARFYTNEHINRKQANKQMLKKMFLTFKDSDAAINSSYHESPIVFGTGTKRNIPY